jgi:hypothetical protein
VRIESQNLANISDITAFHHPKYFGREGAFFLQEGVEGRLLGEVVHDDSVPDNQVIIWYWEVVNVLLTRTLLARTLISYLLTGTLKSKVRSPAKPLQWRAFPKAEV